MFSSSYEIYLIRPVLENYRYNDFYITVTFSWGISDDVKEKEFNRIINRLKTLYKKENKVLKYIAAWGRGDEKGNLHFHMMINNVGISRESIIEKCQKNKAVARVTTLRGKYSGDYEIEVMRKCAYYLWKQYDNLNENDKLRFKRRWYASQSLSRFFETEKVEDEIDSPIEKSLSKQYKSICKTEDFNAIDSIIRKCYDGYRLLGYGYENSPTYTTEYGQTFVKLTLVKIGGRFDNHFKVITYKDKGIEKRLKIDTRTGEVI